MLLVALSRRMCCFARLQSENVADLVIAVLACTINGRASCGRTPDGRPARPDTVRRLQRGSQRLSLSHGDVDSVIAGPNENAEADRIERNDRQAPTEWAMTVSSSTASRHQRSSAAESPDRLLICSGLEPREQDQRPHQSPGSR